MGAEPSSLEKAFFEASAEMDRVEGESSYMGGPIQPGLLDSLRDPATGKLPGNVFQLVRQAEDEARRSPGRPKGARNKRSDDLAKLYLARFPDPVLSMGAIANTPLDQFIETMLQAEGASAREDRLLGLVDRCEEMIAAMMRQLAEGGLTAALVASDKGEHKLDKLIDLVDRVVDMAKGLKMKPGDLAIKALNLQLAAHAKAAEYVHSKKPVEANVSMALDGVMVMAGAPAGASFDQQDTIVRQAAAGIEKMLREGHIDPQRLGDFRFVDGQFVEAEFEEVGEVNE